MPLSNDKMSDLFFSNVDETTLEDFVNNDLAKILKETSVKQVSVEGFAEQLRWVYLPRKL